ncbi:restriction endonuclease [Haloferax sp. DFSO52]|uniref:restriction endonuclease n=1 Tax=Haloferax sp. DFSO52 TaxID=3388505 RepID=UPI003A89F465
METEVEEIVSYLVANTPFDLEEFVAGLHRAMDYSTQITSDGADHGVDEIAHPDALGEEFIELLSETISLILNF